jgi:malate dehydrogenase (oxaloacetate-decarboxylating)
LSAKLWVWTAFSLQPVKTIEEQSFRAYKACLRKPDDLERHIYLRQLQDTNEVLFYRLLLDHIEEMLPIVYTPVVAEACQEFSPHLPTPARPDYFLSTARPHRESASQPPKQRRKRDCSYRWRAHSGNRRPGGGRAWHTHRQTFPVHVDWRSAASTNFAHNFGRRAEERLADPEVLGWRHERITGDGYYDFVDRLVQAVKKELPDTLLQWEEFSKAHARPILDRYRDQLITFNDDIQGTAAVTAGAIFSAVHASNRRLRDQHVVMLGAGSAGIGVADSLREAMVADGLSETEASSHFWVINSGGLVHSGRTDLSAEQRRYAQPVDRLGDFPRTLENHQVGLSEVIHKIDATILIGLSTMPGAFTESIVREMTRKCERPIILPLSNPTSKSEAVPEDLVHWTNGRALIATGSPFPDVTYKGRKIRISQCNNVFIFPAIALAVSATHARRVTDGMFLAAARALAKHSPALAEPGAPLLPALTGLRRAAVEIAFAAGERAQREGLCVQSSPECLRNAIVSAQWAPVYPSYL